MSPAEPNDLELMQFADRELSPERHREVSAALMRDPMLREKLAGIEQVTRISGEHLKAELDDAYDSFVSSETLWQNIARELREPSKVAAGDVTGDRQLIEPEQKVSWWNALLAWIDDKRGYFATSLVSAGAAAALMWGFRPNPKPELPTTQAALPGSLGNPGSFNNAAVGGVMPVASNPCGPGTQPTARTAELAGDMGPPSIENLEFYGSSGMVLRLPADDSDSEDSGATVLWLSPGENGEWGGQL